MMLHTRQFARPNAAKKDNAEREGSGAKGGERSEAEGGEEDEEGEDEARGATPLARPLPPRPLTMGPVKSFVVLGKQNMHMSLIVPHAQR